MTNKLELQEQTISLLTQSNEKLEDELESLRVEHEAMKAEVESLRKERDAYYDELLKYRQESIKHDAMIQALKEIEIRHIDGTIEMYLKSEIDKIIGE